MEHVGDQAIRVSSHYKQAQQTGSVYQMAAVSGSEHLHVFHFRSKPSIGQSDSVRENRAPKSFPKAK